MDLTAVVKLPQGEVQDFILDLFLKLNIPFQVHKSKPIWAKDILEIGCQYYAQPPEFFLEKNRSRVISSKRMILIYLAREYTDDTDDKIGEIIGEVKESYVVRAYQSIVNLIITDSKIEKQVTELKKIIELW